MTVLSPPPSSDSVTKSDTSTGQRLSASHPQIRAALEYFPEVDDDEELLGAAECYARIENELRSSDFLPVALLSNIAAVAIEQNDVEAAFFHAGVVAALPHTPFSAKAYYRALMTANNPSWAVWPFVLLHVHKCTGQLSIGSQHLLAKKTAELQTHFGLAEAISNVAEEGLRVNSTTDIQPTFCHRLSQSAVQFLKDHGKEPSVAPDTCDGSLAHAKKLKEAGNEAFRSKQYALAISKYREGLSTFHRLPSLLLEFYRASKKWKTPSHLGGVLIPLAALAIQPRCEQVLLAAAEGADSSDSSDSPVCS